MTGHTGIHRTGQRRGGLAEFLGLCKIGEIPAGFYLLVESFNRLSREHPLDAMDLLKQLSREYGIILVVMRPSMILDAESQGRIEGIISYIETMRAYGESVDKSAWSKSSWK